MNATLEFYSNLLEITEPWEVSVIRTCSGETFNLTVTLSSWRRVNATEEEKHEADQEDHSTEIEQQFNEHQNYRSGNKHQSSSIQNTTLVDNLINTTL